MNPQFITTFTLAIYFSAAFSAICGLVFAKKIWKQAGVYLSITAFAAQTLFLLGGYHTSFEAGPTMGAYLQLVAWFILLCGIIAWKKFSHEIFLLLSAPLGLILFLMSVPYVIFSLHLPSFINISFYILHIGALFLSISFISLGFISALVFLFLESRLKRKSFPLEANSLPGLILLDRINSFCALSAFPLYTLGLATGLIWANPVFGNLLHADAKKITSLVIWFLLAFLFHNRLAKNWKGRKPAICIIIIFVLCLFSIFVVNFFIPTHHNFSGN